MCRPPTATTFIGGWQMGAFLLRALLLLIISTMTRAPYLFPGFHTMTGGITNRNFAHRLGGTLTVEQIFAQIVHFYTLDTPEQVVTGLLALTAHAAGPGLTERLLEAISGIPDEWEKSHESAAEVLASIGSPVEQAGNVRLTFGQFVDRFGAFRTTPIFKHLRRIFALLFCAVVEEEKMRENHAWVYKRVIDASEVAKLDALDIMGEVLGCFRVAWDTVDLCMAERSLGPLFGANDSAVLMESEYMWVKNWLPHYKNGILERVSARGAELVREPEFVERASKLHVKLSLAHKREKNPAVRLTLMRMLDVVAAALLDIREKETRDTTRPAPFGIKLDGPTGQGKTADMAKMVKDILRIQGQPFGDEYIATVRAGSKYQDNVHNQTKGIIMDDVGNIKPAFAKNDDNGLIIEIQNNAKGAVEKSHLEDKGGTFYNCSVFCISTNVPHLHGKEISAEPSALMRRFAVHIDVRVREEYSTGDARTLPMLDPSKLDNGMATQSRIYTIKKYYPLKRAVDGNGDAPDNGELRVIPGGSNLTYSGLMEKLAPMVRSHMAQQKAYLADLANDANRELCEHGFTTQPFCAKCNPRHLYSTVEQAGDMGERVTRFFLPDVRPINDSDDEFEVGSISSAEPSPLETVVEGVPEPVNGSGSPSWRERAYMLGKTGYVWSRMRWNEAWRSDEPIEPRFVGVLRSITRGAVDFEGEFLVHPSRFLFGLFGVLPALASAAAYLGAWCIGVSSFFTAMAVLCSGLGTVFTLSRTVVCWVRGRVSGLSLLELRERARSVVRSHGMAVMLGTLSVLAMGYTLTRMARKSPDKGDKTCTMKYTRGGEDAECPGCNEPAYAHDPWTPQGGCESTAAVLPQPLPDRVNKPNVWEKRELTQFRYIDGPERNMTHDDAMQRILRQFYVVSVEYASKTVTTLALFVGSNHVLMPAHNFLRIDGSFSQIIGLHFKRTQEFHGPRFTCKVDPTVYHRMPGDMMLVQVNNCGTKCDITPFFTERGALPARLPVVEYTRTFDTCEVEMLRYRCDPQTVQSSQYGFSYEGLVATRPQPTFVGLCGALWVMPERFPRILAMHTMGDGHMAIACRVYREDILEGLEALRLGGTNGSPLVNMPTTTPHVPAGFEQANRMVELAPNSVVRETPDGLPLIVVGTLAQHSQVRARSVFDKSPLSDDVEELCGEPRLHGPPKQIGKITVEKNKLHEIQEIAQIEPRFLKMAEDDMYRDMAEVVETHNLQGYLVPLDERSTCSGIPASSSVNRINTRTAAGWPRVGSKLVLIEPSPTPEQPAAICLTDEQRAEVEQIEAQMEELIRVNFMFKWSHKDEPTKFTKNKVRVFEGAPFALTFLFRKYFMPLIRLMMMFPLLFESAVGINATGPEWNAFVAWLMVYNPSHVLEGDWQHFDMSIHYQEIMAVFTVWIRLLETYGQFTAAQIRIMWCIAEEVACHYALAKGDVLIMVGGNPSGNSATVQINNGSNGLRMRAFFFANRPVECTGRFRDYARAMFYGDDFSLAVKPEVEGWFTQRAMETWFGTQGKVMTSPAKVPFTEDFTPYSRASFLKRGFRWDAGLGHYMAPLELNSIYKSLHVWPTKLAFSKEVHAAEVISGAIRELFQHGEAVYNERVPPILEVARRHGAESYLEAADFATYAGAAASWRAKYLEASE